LSLYQFERCCYLYASLNCEVPLLKCIHVSIYLIAPVDHHANLFSGREMSTPGGGGNRFRGGGGGGGGGGRGGGGGGEWDRGEH